MSKLVEIGCQSCGTDLSGAWVSCGSAVGGTGLFGKNRK